jgi:hypothetical protein
MRQVRFFSGFVGALLILLPPRSLHAQGQAGLVSNRPESFVGAQALSADGSLIAVSSLESVSIWRSEDGVLISRVSSRTTLASALAFGAAQDLWIGTTSGSLLKLEVFGKGTATIWKVPEQAMAPDDAEITSVAVCRSKAMAAAATMNGQVWLVSPDTKTAVPFRETLRDVKNDTSDIASADVVDRLVFSSSCDALAAMNSNARLIRA